MNDVLLVDGPRSTVHGLWTLVFNFVIRRIGAVRGLWTVVCGLLLPVHGRRSTVDGLGILMFNLVLRRIVAVRGLWTVVCGLLSMHAAVGQHVGYKPVSDLQAFKKQFALEAKKIQSIKSSFEQEKNLALLEEKIMSSGKFYFKRESKVRIEYQKPFQYLMIMNGEQILIRDSQKESKVNVKSNKLFQQVNNIMIDCVRGSIIDNKDFTFRVFENDKTWLLEMTPISKSLKDFFKTIIIHADHNDYSVLSIDMREPSGDNTLIRFTQKELNVPVQDEVFKVN